MSMVLFVWSKFNTAMIFEEGYVPEMVLEEFGQKFVELSSIDVLTKSCTF